MYLMLRSFPYNKLILNYFGKINVCWHAAAYRLNEPSTARQDANLRAECQKGIPGDTLGRAKSSVRNAKGTFRPTQSERHS